MTSVQWDYTGPSFLEGYWGIFRSDKEREEMNGLGGSRWDVGPSLGAEIWGEGWGTPRERGRGMGMGGWQGAGVGVCGALDRQEGESSILASEWGPLGV